MWPHLCRKKWASLIWFKSMVVAICTGWYKNWHGLYESSYCYHIIYVITCNLNAPELGMQSNTYSGSHTTW